MESIRARGVEKKDSARDRRLRMARRPLYLPGRTFDERYAEVSVVFGRRSGPPHCNKAESALRTRPGRR